MDKAEMKIIEVNWNLEQLYLKCKKLGNESMLLSIRYAIYSYNGLVNATKPNCLSKKLMSVGQKLHNDFMEGKRQPIEGVGQGLDWDE